MDIAAIIFDCDGVLVNSEALGVEVERRALARVGLEYEYHEFLTRFTGLADADLVESADTERRKRLGAGLPADFVQALNDEKQRLFSTALKAIDGVIALVESIAIPKAVASSATSAELIDKLRFTGLHHLFEPHIYSTELVEAGKPAPDIYFFAAGKLRCVPAQCLVIEDSVNGVRAGVAAGMTV